MDDALAAQICLRDAWPSLDTRDLSGWQLRAGRGGYNRVNSVWTGSFTGEVPLEDAIDRAEAFYRERGLGPRFQMLDSARPLGLDGVLQGLGYRSDPECTDLQKTVVRVPMPADATVTDEAPDEWIVLYGSEQPPQKAVEFPRIIRKLLPVRGFIVCRRNGRADAVALVSCMGGDAAVDCVLTRPAARRTGAARTVMMAAEAWAAARGARRMLLSVVNDNAAAVPLYAQLGYGKLSSYHYRFKSA